jgi:hypothetical protein
MTTVISVRGKSRDELEADPNFVYVGRAVPRTRWKASKWGNPFKAGCSREVPFIFLQRAAVEKSIDRFVVIPIDWLVLTSEQAVDLFRRYVLASPSHRERLGELRGKTLGCWCGGWRPGQPDIACHAVCLAKLADAMEDD